MSDYTTFLREKIKLAQFKGFEVAPSLFDLEELEAA